MLMVSVRGRWDRRAVVSRCSIPSTIVVRPIYTEFPPHYVEVVEVAHRGGCSVRVGEFGETKSLRTSSFLVVYKTEVEHLANAPEGV